MSVTAGPVAMAGTSGLFATSLSSDASSEAPQPVTTAATNSSSGEHLFAIN
jgi:hypothetical protein